MNIKPRAPNHLRPATKAWFEDVIRDYELEPHHRRLLQLAAEAWDDAQAARAAIAKHGAVFEDRFGTPKSRPEIAIARDSRLAFARLLRELGLDDVDPPAPPRPPRVGGKRG